MAEKNSEIRNTLLWRIYVVMFIMIILSVIVFLRVFSIQYFDGERLRAKAATMYIKKMPIEAARGNILTENGSLLAASLPYFDVAWDATIVPRDTFYKYLDTLAFCLANFDMGNKMTAGAWYEALREAHEKKQKYFIIRRNMSYIDVQRLRTFPLFNLGDRNKTGLRADPRSKRQYPFGQLAHRTVGYVRNREKLDALGQPIREDGEFLYDTVMVGLERSFNHILAGQEEKVPMQLVGPDLWVPLDDISKIEPKPGKDIVTTLDLDLQEVAQTALYNALRTYQADHGCAIVMEVQTGAIRAIVNLGANKDRSQYWEDYNYALAENAEPGSTFKIASMMALMEEGVLNINDTITLNYGRMKFYDETMEDAMAHGLNRVPIWQAFEVSSNVGIAQLINKHFNDNKAARHRYIKHLKNFQLDKPVCDQLEGERAPFIKTPDRNDWSGITAPWMAIGYELEMSPLQLLTFYNAIANGGKMMRPMLVKEIRNYGHTEEIFEPQVIHRHIASKETIRQAKELLLRPVQGPRGTARTIKTNEYLIAGKTGTAIMNYREATSGRSPKRYRASFAGFFPADNPAYTCVVVITNPRSGFYGGVVAAPVFREIADHCHHKATKVHRPINDTAAVYIAERLPDLQVGYREDLKYILNFLSLPHKDETTTTWSVSAIRNDSVILSTRNIQEDFIPNVVGMTLKDALFLLENLKIKVKVVGTGKVKSQSVKPGRSAKGVQNMTLVLG